LSLYIATRFCMDGLRASTAFYSLIPDFRRYYTIYFG